MPCESHGKCKNRARQKRFELLTPRSVVWCTLTLSAKLAVWRTCIVRWDSTAAIRRLSKVPVAEEKYETDKDDEGHDYIPPILSTHLRSIGTGKPSP